MTVQRIIHRQNPFVASRHADQRARAEARKDPDTVKFFAEREVQNRDGSFPFGEGYLYFDRTPRRDDGWEPGRGQPHSVGVAGHRGSKREQQDAFGTLHRTVGEHEVAALVVSDGVSASGPLAKKASNRATEVFLERFAAQIEAGLPTDERARHLFVEEAMERAATAANFEVVRQVLLDRSGDGRFDQNDRAWLQRNAGITLTTGRMSPTEMRLVAAQLDDVVERLAEEGREALCTFAVAVSVGNDVYTFSSGDAVVGLYRPDEPEGRRFVHLTHRDQAVVELYKERHELDLEEYADEYENLITDSFGDSARLSGTLRRFPNLLEPGDRVVVASDGLGPRGGEGGLSREEIETVLEQDGTARQLAKALVSEQVKDLEPGEYQDNIGVAVLTVGSDEG